MTDKIKFYLEDRLKRLEDIKNKREWTTAELGDATCCKQTLAFINSLQEEPVSEDLEIAIENSMPKPYFHIEDGDDYYGEDAYNNEQMANMFNAGAEWKIAKLIKDATEAVVAIDSGGYPYIDKTIELYDYDKDVPLAKEGDKYKVILIKEE